jgi:hypothetical protein
MVTEQVQESEWKNELALKVPEVACYNFYLHFTGQNKPYMEAQDQGRQYTTIKRH